MEFAYIFGASGKFSDPCTSTLSPEVDSKIEWLISSVLTG